MNIQILGTVKFNPATGLMSVWDAEMEIPDYMPFKEEVVETLEHYESEMAAKDQEIEDLKEQMSDRSNRYSFNACKPTSSIFSGFVTPELGGSIAYHVASGIMKEIFRKKENARNY